MEVLELADDGGEAGPGAAGLGAHHLLLLLVNPLADGGRLIHLCDAVLLLAHTPQEVTAMTTVRRQGRRPQPRQHGTKARMWRSGQCIDDAGETMLRRGSVESTW